MQNNFFRPSNYSFKKRTIHSSESPLNWWERFLQKIKNWDVWKNNKTIYLQKNKYPSKVIPFTQPIFKVAIKSIFFNTSIEPSISIFLFAKETSHIQIYLRDDSKKIFHQSSHLILEGEQDLEIILKNNSILPDTVFLQIKEYSGKTQTQKVYLN